MAPAQSFLVILLLVSSSSGLGDCPEGSADYGDRNECIYPVNANTNYTIAKQVCRNVGGQIVKIRDLFENVISGTQAGSQVGSSALSFIGVVKGSDGTWIYDDGTQLTYTNWQSGHPLDDSDCAVISSASNQWTSVGCNSLHTFICTMPDDNCPRDWVSYNGKCYYFYSPHLTAPVQKVTQSMAQSSCQSVQSNLVSIQSDDEWNFLKNQISTASPTTVDCSYSQAVIGFTCDNNVFTWLDGSVSDYSQSRGYCGVSYGIINDTRCSQSAYWESSTDSGFTYARYICKKSPTRMTIDLKSVLKKFMKL